MLTSVEPVYYTRCVEQRCSWISTPGLEPLHLWGLLNFGELIHCMYIMGITKKK